MERAGRSTLLLLNFTQASTLEIKFTRQMADEQLHLPTLC